MYQSEWFLSMKDNVYQTMSRINTSFTQSYKSMKGLQSELDVFGNKTKRVGSNVDELNSKLNELTKTRNLSVDTSELKRLNREIDLTHKQIGKLTGGEGRKFSEGMSMLPGGYLLGMARNPYVIGGAAIAGAGMLGYEAAQTRLSFDRSFAKVNATAQYSPAQLSTLRNEIMDMGRNSTGADIRGIPDAYEKILSAVNDPVLAKRILEVSLKGAQAGFADINTVSNALVGFKSIVGNVGESEIMDVLFGAKRVGKGEFNDFAQYLPRAMSMAPKGTSYKDVAGMYSYLTTKGFDAQTSGMLLENVFNQFGRSDVTSAFKGIGIPIFQNGKMRDMLSIFTELGEKMKGLNQEQQSFLLENLGFRDMQAKMGVKALISDLSKLKDVMGEVKSGKKELDAALSFTQNGQNSVQELTNKWIYFKDLVGKTTAPALITVVDKLTAVLDGFNLASKSPDEVFSMKKSEMMGLMRQNDQATLNKNSPTYRDWFRQGRLIGLSADELDIQFEQYRQMSKFVISKDDPLRKSKMILKYGLNPEGSTLIPRAPETTTATADPAEMIGDITGGGSIKNVNVTVGKLVEQININTANLDEGLEEVGTKTLDQLTRVILGAEQVLSGG